jgi:hypothetical protein
MILRRGRRAIATVMPLALYSLLPSLSFAADRPCGLDKAAMPPAKLALLRSDGVLISHQNGCLIIRATAAAGSPDASFVITPATKFYGRPAVNKPIVVFYTKGADGRLTAVRVALPSELKLPEGIDPDKRFGVRGGTPG